LLLEDSCIKRRRERERERGGGGGGVLLMGVAVL